MGTYATTTELYSDRITRINTSSVVAASIVSSYITKAEAVIDGFAVQQYTLPFTDVPQLITELTKDLTLCYMLEDGYTRDNHNRNDNVQQKKVGIFELLEKVGTGDLKLVHSNTILPVNVSADMKSNYDGVPMIMNVDNPLDWQTSYKLDNIIDEERTL